MRLFQVDKKEFLHFHANQNYYYYFGNSEISSCSFHLNSFCGVELTERLFCIFCRFKKIIWSISWKVLCFKFLFYCLLCMVNYCMTFLMHLMLFCVENKTCYLPSAIIRSSIIPMGNGAPDDYLLMGLMGPCNHFFFIWSHTAVVKVCFIFKKGHIRKKIKHFGKWRKFTFCKDHFTKGVAF